MSQSDSTSLKYRLAQFARILSIQIRRLMLRGKQSLGAVRGWHVRGPAKEDKSLRGNVFSSRRDESTRATLLAVPSKRRDSEPAWRFSAVTGTLGILLMLFLLISSLISASVPSGEEKAEAKTREKNPSYVSNSLSGDETTVPYLTTRDDDDPFASSSPAVEDRTTQTIPVVETNNDLPSDPREDVVSEGAENSWEFDLDIELERIAPSVVSDGISLETQNDEEFFVTSESSLDEFSHVDSVGTNRDNWKQYTRPESRAETPGPRQETVIATVSSSASAALSTLVQGARLQLDVSIPQNVAVGQPCQLQFTVSNRGPVEATKVVLSSSLSPTLVHPQGRQLDHTIGTLKAGDVYVARLTVRATATGEAKSRTVVVAAGGLSEKVEKRIPVFPKRTDVREPASAKNPLPRCCFIAR